MSGESQLFRVDPNTRESNRIEEVDFARLGLRERQDIQEWVEANSGILGDDLLIISKEFSGFDRTNERLDLLAVDSDGKLVVIELKRDYTGADAHWQAIKYASYFQGTSADAIVGIAAKYWTESEEEARTRLLKHLNADGLTALNNDQRIILASHRFAPEVTSAALWLNQKVTGKNLITCIKLTPYRDAQTDSLYVQASTIIPVPGIDDYLVGVGQSQQSDIRRRSNSFADNLQKAYDRNKDDEVTHFLQTVGKQAKPESDKQDKPADLKSAAELEAAAEKVTSALIDGRSNRVVDGAQNKFLNMLVKAGLPESEWKRLLKIATTSQAEYRQAKAAYKPAEPAKPKSGKPVVLKSVAELEATAGKLSEAMRARKGWEAAETRLFKALEKAGVPESEEKRLLKLGGTNFASYKRYREADKPKPKIAAKAAKSPTS